MLDEFLKEETTNLSEATQRKYQDIVELLKDSLNGYAYQNLDKSESKKYERLYNEGTEFCDIFGPDHILRNLDEFLGYFMVRKVIASKETLHAAGTVTKKLATWLDHKGYVKPDESKEAKEKAAIAAKLLPKAEECAKALYKLAQEQPFGLEEDITYDQFEIIKVEPGKIWLESIMGGESIGPVSVPKEVTSKCEPGWTVSLGLREKKGKWIIVEVGNVYPL